jgi:hypothetical protein
MKNKVYGTLRSDFEDEIEESAWGIGQVGEKHPKESPFPWLNFEIANGEPWSTGERKA